MVRVHDVRETVEAVRLADAIYRGWPRASQQTSMLL